MAYAALKPCSFGGRSFRIGDAIPAALVRPEMVRRLLAMGKIAETGPEKSRKNKPEAGEA